MVSKEGKFDCCENGLVLKTYQGILKTLIENYGSKEKVIERQTEIKTGIDIAKQNTMK